MNAGKLCPTINESKWKELTLNAVAASYNAACSAYDLAAQIEENKIPSDFRGRMYMDTNLYAKTHMRAVKEIVSKIRKYIYLFNQEIKYMANSKQKVIKNIDRIKINMKISRDTLFMKNRNPLTSQKNDGTYDLVNAELSHLKSLHAQLLHIYKFADEKLTDFHEIKKRLSRVLSERSVVLNFIVENSAGPTFQRPATTRPQCRSNEDMNLGYETTESRRVLRDGETLLQDSAKTRRTFEEYMRNFNERNQSIQNAVNDGIFSKIVENKALQTQLHLGFTQNRQATNRLNSEMHKATTSLDLLNGPFKYTDIGVNERLDRPIVQLLQRHPGTQVPEAQTLTNAVRLGQITKNKISEKVLQQNRMKADLEGEMKRKTTSIDQDSKLIRERIRRGNSR